MPQAPSNKRKIIAGVLVIAVLAAGGAYYALRQDKTEAVAYKTAEEKDEYVRFLMEGFDKIGQNYWEKTDEAAMAGHFQLSLQKAQNSITMPILATKDRAGASKMLAEAMSLATSTDAKKNLALNTLNVALYNLQPVGRNSLLSQTQETAFRDNVANVDQSKDLYQDLGLEKGASEADVKVAYEKKAAELAASTSPEAIAELEKASHAKDVLANPNTKDLYDTAKIEPTASTNVIGKTLYIKIDKISPTTLLEFGRTVYAATTTPGLNSMVIDFRQNLGGALDFAQHFLGLFLGQNQFAFDLYQQDVYNVQRTAQPYFPELARYKNIVILTDGMTQSTAEVTTAAFKRFKLGTVVGETTRGWGTVENTFPLDTVIDSKEKYLMLLVHSITLREDNQPTEGRGIDPDVNIKDPNWKTQLRSRLGSEEFAKTVESVLAK
ncbi:MAG TPA: S41 family peptidase [Candidatus Paceibacterota bacterium]